MRNALAIACFLLAVAMVVQTMFGADGFSRRQQLASDLQTIQVSNAEAAKEAAELKAKIQSLRSNRAYQEFVIRDELGYVKPGELVLELGGVRGRSGVLP